MLVTLEGMDTDVSPVQPWNAYCSMVVILLPANEREVMLVRPLKALSPMVTTLAGMVIASLEPM